MFLLGEFLTKGFSNGLNYGAAFWLYALISDAWKYRDVNVIKLVSVHVSIR